MAFVLNQEIVKDLIEEVNEANAGFQFHWETYSLGTYANESSPTSCLFVENTGHFALVQLRDFDVATITDVRIIDKSEIQGVKIRKGIINTILKIRMLNGDFYKLIFTPKAGKKLPLHAENLTRYRMIFEREFHDRRDLKDHQSGMAVKYWTALTWLLALVLAILVIVFTQSKLLALGVTVAVFYGMAFLAGYIEVSVAKRKDSGFFKEIQNLEGSRSTMTDDQYYQALVTISEKPQTKMYQSLYYERLIKISHQLGRLEEAQSYLGHFPRRHSSGTEETYQSLVNLLALEQEVEEKDRIEVLKD